MRLGFVEEIQKIDRLASEEYSIPAITLMENAGSEISAEILNELKRKKVNLQNTSIAVVVGPGNNGGDGLVIARYIFENKIRNLCVYYIEPEHMKNSLWKTNFDRLNEVKKVKINNENLTELKNFDFIIDAVFGIGLNRAPSGIYQETIKAMNKANKKIFSVDVPSGLDANNGVPYLDEYGNAICIKAYQTISVALAKPGFFINDGPRYCGKIKIISAGFPKELLKAQAQKVFLIGKKSARRIRPKRNLKSNKTNFGHLLVIAGSQGMEGAALLTAKAAARSGVGYVTICSKSPETYLRAPEDFLQLKLDQFFQSDLKKYSAVVVGPGLGVDSESLKILDHLLKNHAKVLVDADMLTALANSQKLSLPKQWLITPHAGELSRIIKMDSKRIEGRRFEAIKNYFSNQKNLILLKGFRTIVSNNEKYYIIGSGNVALAKAGTGDVLAGIIGSFMAQGMPTLYASILGAFIHGYTADEWIKMRKSDKSFMAQDLIDSLPIHIDSFG